MKILKNKSILTIKIILVAMVMITTNSVSAIDSEYLWKDAVGGSNSIMTLDGSKIMKLDEDNNSHTIKLFTSTDNGVSWDSGKPVADGSRELFSSADGSKLVFKGKWNEQKMYISSDSGDSWSVVSTASSSSTIGLSPDGRTLVELYSQAGKRILRVSSDDGQNWEQINSVPSGYNITVRDGGKIFIYGSTAHISTDYGKTWSEIDFPNSFMVRTFAVSEDGNSMVAFTGINAIISTDGGHVWKQVNHPKAPDHTSTYFAAISNDGSKIALTFEPNSSSPSESDIKTSVDGGLTWENSGKRALLPKVFMSSDGDRLYSPEIGHIASLNVAKMDRFDVSTVAGNLQDIDTILTNSVIETQSLHCYDIDDLSVKILSANGITPSEQNIKMIGGMGFNINCMKPSSSSNITISLGDKFSDLSKLRIYQKKLNSSTLEDITKLLTVKNEVKGGKEVTTIAYKSIDGANYDIDEIVNSLITSQLYFGVVDIPESGVVSNHNTPSGMRLLAKTGSSLWLIGGVAIFIIVSGMFLIFYKKSTF